MNTVILKPDELDDDGCVLLSDHRARHILQVLKAEVGQSVRVGVLNGALGEGVIQELGGTSVRLACSFNGVPRPELGLDLILALPRPLVMRRLFAPLASLGVRRIFLTNANKVERNYFDTHWLRPKHYEPLLIEGLEQAGDTRMPEVTQIKRLKPFLEDRLDELFPGGARIIAHPSREEDQYAVPDCTKEMVLAMGPEGGWTEYEMDMFESRGFIHMSLGARTLRTDTACIALISVLRYIVHAG